MTLAEIRLWFSDYRRRRELGESVFTISELSDRAGVSRQTVYALLRDERSEFGEVAQIRLSRVIRQISADPSYQHTRLMKVDLGDGTPRLLLGGQR